MIIKKEIDLQTLIALLVALGGGAAGFYNVREIALAADIKAEAAKEYTVDFKKDITERLDRIEDKLDTIRGHR